LSGLFHKHNINKAAPTPNNFVLFLSRLRTMDNRSLWVVDDFSKLVCVKSSVNNMWMRAKVLKKNTDNSVRRTSYCSTCFYCLYCISFSFMWVGFHTLCSTVEI